MCEARRAEYVRLLDEEGMNFTQAAHAVGVSKRTGKAWRNGRTRATGRNEKPLVDWYRSTMDVLLQCLFDRFGSVFPQCGLMVFPGVVIVSR